MAPARRVALQLGGCLISLLLPVVAAAQDPPDPRVTLPTPGVVAVRQVENGPAVGFDMKFVDVGGQGALFTGVASGYVFDGKLVVGAGAYMRIDRTYPRTDVACGWSTIIIIPVMTCSEQVVIESGDFYGGLQVRWRALRTNRVSFGVGGLAGAGLVKIGWDGSRSVVNPVVPSTGSDSSADGSYLYEQMYLVFEPQVDVAVALGGPVVLAGSAGYRLIGSANGLDDHLRGMTASISVRFRLH
jgi:hypothetical protein